MPQMLLSTQKMVKVIENMNQMECYSILHCDSLSIDVKDLYMAQLRHDQGISTENRSDLSMCLDEEQLKIDVFDVTSSDSSEDGVSISAYKLMLSVLSSDFKLAQQVDDHLRGSVRKATTKFPRLCALLSLVEITGAIASKLVKYIVFDDGNFSRPSSTTNKYISIDFVIAARQAVKDFLSTQVIINSRPIIYIDKGLVEQAHLVYITTWNRQQKCYSIFPISIKTIRLIKKRIRIKICREGKPNIVVVIKRRTWYTLRPCK